MKLLRLLSNAIVHFLIGAFGIVYLLVVGKYGSPFSSFAVLEEGVSYNNYLFIGSALPAFLFFVAILGVVSLLVMPFSLFFHKIDGTAAKIYSILLGIVGIASPILYFIFEIVGDSTIITSIVDSHIISVDADTLLGLVMVSFCAIIMAGPFVLVNIGGELFNLSEDSFIFKFCGVFYLVLTILISAVFAAIMLTAACGKYASFVNENILMLF